MAEQFSLPPVKPENNGAAGKGAGIWFAVISPHRRKILPVPRIFLEALQSIGDCVDPVEDFPERAGLPFARF